MGYLKEKIGLGEGKLLIAGIVGIISTATYYEVNTNKNEPSETVARVVQINKSLDSIYHLLEKKLFESKGLNNNTTTNPYIKWSISRHLDEQNRLQLYKTIDLMLADKAQGLNAEKNNLENLTTINAKLEKYEQRKEEIEKNSEYMGLGTIMIFLAFFYESVSRKRES